MPQGHNVDEPLGDNFRGGIDEAYVQHTDNTNRIWLSAHGIVRNAHWVNADIRQRLLL